MRAPITSPWSPACSAPATSAPRHSVTRRFLTRVKSDEYGGGLGHNTNTSRYPPLSVLIRVQRFSVFPATRLESHDDQQPRTLPARAARAARRRRFAGARLQIGGRRTVHHGACRGPVPVGCRRQALHRLRGL